MNWTDSEQKRLRDFYRMELVPVADKLRQRGVGLLALSIDDEGKADSWYEAPPSDVAEFIEFEPEAIAETMAAHWNTRGLPELAALAEKFAELAQLLEVDEEHSTDVSPFIYVMW